MRGLEDGTFLIRESRKRLGVFVLSMLQDRKTYHFEISKQGIYYFTDQVSRSMSYAQCVKRKVTLTKGGRGVNMLAANPV